MEQPVFASLLDSCFIINDTDPRRFQEDVMRKLQDKVTNTGRLISQQTLGLS
jgi:hypothetical protein